MRTGALLLGLVLPAATGLAAGPLAAQTLQTRNPEARRAAAHGLALARIGRSGLRRLLASSGGIGDLQNRSGSYRLVSQLERTRLGVLEGEIAGLDRALGDAGLPPEQRDVLLERREIAAAEIRAIPAYTTTYSAATLQGEALVPSGFVGDRPLFLLLRVRGHGRWGGSHDLGVRSEVATAAPVLLLSDRWLLAPGVTLGRTDIDIGPFDGSSGATSAGPTLSLGGIITDAWSFAVQLSHAWSRGGSTILRPGADGPTEVTTDASTRTTSAKAEALGSFALGGRGDHALTLSPRVGTFALRTRVLPTTNSLGETGTGPFGGVETVAVVRAGAALRASPGSWSPSLYLGWESELTDVTSAL
ncbi:MAG: hypothetical protein P8170_16995, partial [Gemmatimonadota bacterium]